MELTTELKSVLNDTEEPLVKRLKIAHNALNSIELIGINKEEILLEWFSKVGKKYNSGDVWNTLNSVLSSQNLLNFRQNEIRQDTLFKLVKTVTHCLNNENLEEDIKKSITDCAILVLKNNGFKQFFKHDFKLYFTFISTVLTNINNQTELISILNDSSIFNQKMFVKSDCCQSFFSKTFNTIIDVIINHENEQLFQSTSKLLQRCIFHNNSKSFETYLTKIFAKADDATEEVIPQLIMSELSELYKSDTKKAQIAFKLIFNAFVNTFKILQLVFYKLFVLILQSIGFENDAFSEIKIPNVEIVVQDDKSSVILADLLEIISKTNIAVDTTLNETKFDDYIKHILKLVLSKTPLVDSSILNIIKTIISINPLTVDSLISDILVCITLSKKTEGLETPYSNVVLAIFEMYNKLHRIHKFTSEILRTLKTSLNEEKQGIVGSLHDVLPKAVFNYFNYCITLQSGKQIISIMRTLVTHFEEIVNNVQDYTDGSSKTLYIQTVTEMMCQFLSAVRIAEYNTTQITLTKFCKDMEELKTILNKFGTSLLKLEHNQNLMFCFLRVSESWANIVIILNYYSSGPTGIKLKDITPLNDIGDYMTCNMTYLHGYLSAEHWQLMTQRIKNFGEKSCQELMQKLLFQKVRSFIILNPSPKLKENQAAIMKKTLTNLNDNLNNLLTENYTSILLLHEDTTHILNIAEFVVEDLLTSEKPTLFEQDSIINNKNMVLAILYTWFTKVNSMFKVKRKHSETAPGKSVSSKVFKCIEVNSFVACENLETILDETAECFNDISGNVSLKIDEEKLLKLLMMPKQLPVCGLPGNVLKILFTYFLALAIDIKRNNLKNEECINLCELYLRGLLEIPSYPNMVLSVPMNKLLEILVENIQCFRVITTFIFNKTFKSDETIQIATNALDLKSKVIPNEIILELAIKVLNSINKTSKNRLSEESKEHIKKYKEDLCNSLIKKILKDNEVTNIKVEIYVLLLQYFLQKEGDENTNKLIPVYKIYVDYCVNNIQTMNSEVGLLLFEILLRNKSKIKLSDDFIMKSWSICKSIKNIDESCLKQLSRTVSLIFEYITNDQFNKVLDNLLAVTIQFIEDENLEDFENYLKIWHCIIHSALSTVKQEKFVQFLLNLLEHITIYMLTHSNQKLDEIVIKLQIDVIENKQIIPSGNMMDVYLQTVSILVSRDYDFATMFQMCVSIMDSLIQKRKYIITDRLPSYLVNLRILLNKLCENSDTNSTINKKDIVDCAFKFEKLMRTACYLKRDMGRIAPYFVGDVLKHYEKITFLPGIKNHLDNCLYFLLEICDHHAVTYLFRVLSSASTELFKNVFDNYNKYYKFAGRI